MIMSIITAIMARWQLSLGILAALVMSHGLTYCKGRDDGREAVKLDLREKQVEAKEESLERVKQGDIAGAKRAEEFAAEQGKAVKAIEEAQANETNSLDALF